MGAKQRSRKTSANPRGAGPRKETRVAFSSKQVRVGVVVAAAFFVAYLIVSSVRQNQQTFEVCVDFHGTQHCASAAGATKEDALRSAQQIDCELLSRSREDNMVCLDQAPSSIKKMTK